jgi:hypothetical protein
LKHRERTAADREDSCCFAIDWGGGRARHAQKAVFRAHDTDIAEQVIVEFERHAVLAAAHPQVADHVEEPADDPGAGFS